MSEQKQRVYDALNKELCARICFSEMQKENVIFSLHVMKMLK